MPGFRVEVNKFYCNICLFQVFCTTSPNPPFPMVFFNSKSVVLLDMVLCFVVESGW